MPAVATTYSGQCGHEEYERLLLEDKITIKLASCGITLAMQGSIHKFQSPPGKNPPEVHDPYPREDSEVVSRPHNTAGDTIVCE